MKKLLLSIIIFYRNYISINMIKHCRFYPSCSQYTIDAIEKYGIMRGIAKGVFRILRCNPLSSGGYDPV